MRARTGGTIALVCGMPWMAACLTSNLVLTVRPDGSGRLEQTTLVRPASIADFDKLTGVTTPTTPDQLWEEIDKRARNRLVGGRPMTPVKNGDSIGTFVAYDFPDVRGLTDVDVIPGLPGLGVFWRATSPDASPATTVALGLEPIADGLERLTIHLPRFRLDPSTEPPSAWASGSSTELAALKNLMTGAHVTITIASEAPLVRTNSPFKEGNRVTLVDVDVAAALFSSDVQRMTVTPGTFDELLAWFATVPGVTLSPSPDITLDFQNPSVPGASGIAAPPSTAASADTEVFLATVIGTGAPLAVGPPANISNNPGYDNQPAFSADGTDVFFTSTRGSVTPPSSALPRTDIFRYEIPSGRLFRITQTPESEFSPTVMPDGRHLSMIRVEADGTQHLCSVEPATNPSRETTVMLPAIKPVGYHAWLDAARVALYILGAPGQPSTLQIASLEDGRTQTVATNVGRALQRMPSGSISFVQREAVKGDEITAVLKELDVGSLETRPLVRFASGITDPFVTWMPDGTALMAAGSTIYRWHPGDRDWSVASQLGGFGLHDITRLAVSPRGDRIAIVAQK